MTAEQFHDALTLLPSDLIAAADKRRSQGPKVIRWQRIAAMAACFALVFFAGTFAMQFLNPMSGATESAADMEMQAAPAEAPAAAAPMETPAEEGPQRNEGSQGVSGTGSAIPEKPPQLTVFCGSNVLTLAPYGYTWEISLDDSTSMAVSADVPAPTDHPERHPVLTAETEAADLSWDIPPLSVTARCWLILEPGSAVNGAAKDVELIGQALTLCPGSHIYEITAQWENGTATYVVLVNTLR